jgi:Domain of unknown function (DUF4270)
MNKQFLSNISLKRLRLFSFLSVTCLAVACIKDPEGLGGDLVPQSDLIAAFETDTIQLQTKLVWVDSVRTDRKGNNNSVLIGTMSDNMFGVTACAANIQFEGLNTTAVVPNELTIDSVFLDLAVSALNYEYGNKRPQRYRVERLTERMYLDTAYFGFTDLAHSTDNIVLNPSPIESSTILIEDGVIKKVLRLRLTNAFGEELMQAAINNRTDVEAFRNAFNGLRVSLDETGGSIARYDMNNQLTQLRVHYSSPPDGTVQRQVSDAVSFSVGSNSEFCTQTTRQFLQSPLSGIEVAQEISTNASLYMQAGFVACEVDYSSLSNFLAQEHLIINNVDLIVPTLSQDDKTRRLPSYLVAIGNAELVNSFYSDLPISASLFNLFGYLSTRNHYRLDITSIVRAYVSGVLEQPNLYLTVSNSDRSVNTAVLAGPAYHPTDRTQNMRMVLTYTNKREE